MTNKQKVVNRCVLRLTTTYAERGNSYTQYKSIRFLKRKCTGYNLLEEGITADGISEAMAQIINLNEVPDGIYECKVVNQEEDRETGELVYFDYQLFPYLTEEETVAVVNDIKADPEFKEFF